MGGITMTLNQLAPGRESIVIKIETDESLRQRLADFGMVPGTLVCTRFRSPGGGMTAISLRGSVIALRTKDLERIRVCPV